MAVRSTQDQNRAIRSTQGGRGCHPPKSNQPRKALFKLSLSVPRDNKMSFFTNDVIRLMTSLP